MQQQRSKLHIFLNYAVIPEDVNSDRVVALKAVDINWFHVTHIFTNLMINSIHA